MTAEASFHYSKRAEALRFSEAESLQQHYQQERFSPAVEIIKQVTLAKSKQVLLQSGFFGKVALAIKLVFTGENSEKSLYRKVRVLISGESHAHIQLLEVKKVRFDFQIVYKVLKGSSTGFLNFL